MPFSGAVHLNIFSFLSILHLQPVKTRSNPKTLATYGAWLVGGVSFGVIRKEFIDPKFESGEWQPIRIELPFISKPDAAVEAAGTLTSKATNMIVDGITNGHDSLDFFA